MERATRFYEHYNGRYVSFSSTHPPTHPPTHSINSTTYPPTHPPTHYSAEKEKVYVVGIAKKRSQQELNQETEGGGGGGGGGKDAFTVEESLTELSELVGTAGLEVAGSTYQKVESLIHPPTAFHSNRLVLLYP